MNNNSQNEPHLLYPIVVTNNLLQTAFRKNLNGYQELQVGKWICARPVLFGCVLIEKPIVFNSKDEALKKAQKHNESLRIPKDEIESLFNQVEFSQN